VFNCHVCGTLFCPSRTTHENVLCCSFTTQTIWVITASVAPVRLRPVPPTLGVVTMLRDLANLRIWAAFLCPHCCPFLHTCRQYQNDPQKTLWATTSNDNLRLPEDKIASPFEEDVHVGRSFYDLQVCAGEPHSMLCHRQDLDTQQIYWKRLPELCLPAIGKSESAPKYRVAIHCTIVLQFYSDPRGLPIRMRAITGIIYVPSMLLKHPERCITPQGTLVVLVLAQFIQNQHGVHSHLVSEQVVSHSGLLIITTS